MVSRLSECRLHRILQNLESRNQPTRSRFGERYLDQGPLQFPCEWTRLQWEIRSVDGAQSICGNEWQLAQRTYRIDTIADLVQGAIAVPIDKWQLRQTRWIYEDYIGEQRYRSKSTCRQIHDAGCDPVFIQHRFAMLHRYQVRIPWYGQKNLPANHTRRYQIDADVHLPDSTWCIAICVSIFCVCQDKFVENWFFYWMNSQVRPLRSWFMVPRADSGVERWPIEIATSTRRFIPNVAE